MHRIFMSGNEATWNMHNCAVDANFLHFYISKSIRKSACISNKNQYLQFNRNARINQIHTKAPPLNLLCKFICSVQHAMHCMYNKSKNQWYRTTSQFTAVNLCESKWTTPTLYCNRVQLHDYDYDYVLIKLRLTNDGNEFCYEQCLSLPSHGIDI